MRLMGAGTQVRFRGGTQRIQMSATQQPFVSASCIVRVLTGFVFAGMSACTEITVVDGGHVETSYWPGLAIVHVLPQSDRPAVVHTVGFGVVAATSSVVLGWSKSTSVAVPDAEHCSIFFFIDNQTQLDTAKELLTLSDQKSLRACFAPGG
jgi:hypothetical protein